MLHLTFLMPFLFGLALSQTSCGSSPITSVFNPVVMRYTPSMPPQKGPTSTVWDEILTISYNAVDCRYVTPLRVDENPTPEGPFTTFIHVPVLTVTRIGCMPETTAVTRREFRGENELERRTASLEQKQKIYKRRTAQEAVDEFLSTMANAFPPDSTELTVQAYRYLVSINTALFAIHVVQAGLDLNQSCAHLRDPATESKLYRTTINPVQAGDIVCFAANNGLYFAAGIDAVVTYLEDLIYAIQVRSTQPEDSDDFCWPQLTEDSPFLGIDASGITNYLCPGSAPTVSTVEPTVTATEETSSTDTLGSQTSAVPPTGGPYANTTAITSTGTSDSGANSTTDAATAPATPAPYTNSTTITSSVDNTTSTTDFNNGTVITTSIVGTAGTTGPVDVSATGIFTNTTSGGVTASTGTGTGAVWETGSLPPAPTTISPSIESVVSAPLRRVRRW